MTMTILRMKKMTMRILRMKKMKMRRTVILLVTWLRGMPLTILASSMAVQQKGILYWPRRLARQILVVQCMMHIGKYKLCKLASTKYRLGNTSCEGWEVLIVQAEKFKLCRLTNPS